MKKTFFLLMLLCFCMLTNLAYAQEMQDCSQYLEYNADGSMVTGVICSDTTCHCSAGFGITIPEKNNGVPVTAIGSSAFYQKGLVELNFAPDSKVTTIGNNAFGSTNLSSVVFPESLTTIGDDAFKQTSVSSVIIPENVTTLGANAFSEIFSTDEDKSLKEVTIKGNTEIGAKAFENCQDLANVRILGKQAVIGQGAFNGCGLDPNQGQGTAKYVTVTLPYGAYRKTLDTAGIETGFANYIGYAYGTYNITLDGYELKLEVDEEAYETPIPYDGGSHRVTGCSATDGSTVITASDEISVEAETGWDTSRTEAGSYPVVVTIGWNQKSLTLNGEWKISPAVLKDSDVSIGPDAAYTGFAQTPAVTVSVNGTSLTAGTDYETAYFLGGTSISANEMIAPGEYTVKISGKGNYSEAPIEKPWKIAKAAQPAGSISLIIPDSIQSGQTLDPQLEGNVLSQGAVTYRYRYSTDGKEYGEWQDLLPNRTVLDREGYYQLTVTIAGDDRTEEFTLEVPVAFRVLAAERDDGDLIFLRLDEVPALPGTGFPTRSE